MLLLDEERKALKIVKNEKVLRDFINDEVATSNLEQLTSNTDSHNGSVSEHGTSITTLVHT